MPMVCLFVCCMFLFLEYLGTFITLDTVQIYIFTINSRFKLFMIRVDYTFC